MFSGVISVKGNTAAFATMVSSLLFISFSESSFSRSFVKSWCPWPNPSMIHAVFGSPTEVRGETLKLYGSAVEDSLVAHFEYPELSERVVAVISVSGAIGGSPLANAADQKDLNIIRRFPGANCSDGDGGAIDSLRPATRRSWLARNPLPDDIAYYSLVTYPNPDRISSVLGTTYRKLSQVDARNDSQLIYYDQVIPGSTLMGFLNADHWAVAVPIARNHSFIGSTFVDKNDYPREAMVEAALRFVTEDMNRRVTKTP